MKILEDGFKIIENEDDLSLSLIAMNENTILLHDMIKKIQGKPFKGIHDGDKGKCPCCGHAADHNYCPECGVKLEWGIEQ